MAALIFGKYEIIRRVAVGGMGEIFLARQTGVAGFDRLVILKSLLPELAQAQESIDEFLDEARVAATLNHPNIVAIYEVGLWEGTYFIAMEYIDGENMSIVNRAAQKLGTPLPYPVIARIIHDAALGLDHAHHAAARDGKPLGIIHRDVSPQNIMVRTDGVTKVVDFGIAKASHIESRTATGILKGKIRYMSPEQIYGQSIDHRSDQYALGVVLWELCARERLFKAASDVIALANMMERPITAPSAIAPEVPPALERIVLTMLARDRDKRFGRLADVAQALGEYLASISRPVRTVEVAAFIDAVVGARVKERTANLEPSKENFFISLRDVNDPTRTRTAGSLSDDESASQSKDFIAAPRDATPISETSQSLRVDGGLAHASRRWPLGFVAGVLVLSAVAGVAAYRMIPPREAPPPPLVAGPRPPERVDGDGSILVQEPVGAKVFVDGIPWAERAPTLIVGLTPGRHALRLEPVDGTPFERHIDVARGAPTVLPTKRQAAVLHVESTPDGASVFLGDKLLGTTPLDVKTLAPDVDHRLVLEKRGWVNAEAVARLAPGEDQKLSISLAETPKPDTRPRIPYEPRPETSEASDGFLTLQTTPWTKVSIDGAPLGSTPLFRVKLTAGAHELHLVNEQASIDVRRKIAIRPDETQKLNLSLGSSGKK